MLGSDVVYTLGTCMTVFIVTCFFIGLLRLIRNGPRGWRWLYLPPAVGVIFLWQYLQTEYVSNKGPDDWGALNHASAPLFATYGHSSRQPRLHCLGFDKDPDGSGSGTYRYGFEYADQKGTVLFRYDKPTRVFGRDNVQVQN